MWSPLWIVGLVVLVLMIPGYQAYRRRQNQRVLVSPTAKGGHN